MFTVTVLCFTFINFFFPHLSQKMGWAEVMICSANKVYKLIIWDPSLTLSGRDSTYIDSTVQNTLDECLSISGRGCTWRSVLSVRQPPVPTTGSRRSCRPSTGSRTWPSPAVLWWPALRCPTVPWPTGVWREACTTWPRENHTKTWTSSAGKTQ